MRQPGEITQVKNGMMQVTFCRPEACAACNACEGGKKEHSIWVKGQGNVGEIAIVDMPDRMVAKASFVAYGMPLLTLLGGMIAGYLATGGKDAGTGIGAAVGLGAGMLALAVTEKGRRQKEEWHPQVVEIRRGSAAEEEEENDEV